MGPAAGGVVNSEQFRLAIPATLPLMGQAAEVKARRLSDRRVTPDRRGSAPVPPGSFQESVRMSLRPPLLDEVDFEHAEALASTIAHVAGNETMSAERRRHLVATLRLLILFARTKG